MNYQISDRCAKEKTEKSGYNFEITWYLKKKKNLQWIKTLIIELICRHWGYLGEDFISDTAFLFPVCLLKLSYSKCKTLYSLDLNLSPLEWF